MIRVLLYEDNKEFREALTDALADSTSICLIKSFKNAKQVISQIKEYKPDVVLMDIEMPSISGLDALSKINMFIPNTKVLIQTQFEDNHSIFIALCRGAWGYVLKSSSFDKLEEAIIEVHQGGVFYSPIIAGKVRNSFLSSLVRK
ncbi:MAG: response regulator transcription factor [Saprospiraceae bacterium]|nr:response regulator transcription factor [Saprospiraceae bacterium]